MATGTPQQQAYAEGWVSSLNKKIRLVDLPFTLHLHGVSEEAFDALVDEDSKAELHDGVMVVPSPASPRHNQIAGFLRNLLHLYAEEKELGSAFGPDDLVRLSPARKYAPDAFFLARERIPSPLPEEQFEVVPDLVIEVLSPSTQAYDLNEKRSAYRQAGVGEIWFVDPEAQQVIVDRRQKRRYTTTTITQGPVAATVLAGFWLESSWLWREPVPTVLPCLRKVLRGPK